MRCSAARFDLYQREQACRIYMADCLQLILERCGGVVVERFADILHPKPQDRRSGDEIAAEVIQKAGIEVI